MKDLIHKLRQNNIAIDVIDSELQLSIPKGLFLDEIIAEVRANKQELIHFIEQAKGSKKTKTINVALEKPYYVLSSAQKRLYFLYEFDRNSLAYNMPQASWLSGELDRTRLEGAFQALIKRHEILRTTIVMIGDEPFQIIGDGAGFSITDYQAQQQDVAATVDSFVRPFDLEKGPLLRVGLVHVPGGESLLMLDMHHIITDGVSHGILIRDFMALYAGKDLPAPGLQYKDYAEWQQSAIEQDRIAKQKSFWLSEYHGLPEVLDLPFDYQRPDHRNHRGDSYGIELDEQTTASLRRLGEKHGATLYAVLLSVYNILLGRLGRREDVVIGTPIAGRRHADLDEMIGMFVNTLALRNYPLGELVFQDFLAEVSSHTLLCFDNQDFQYEDLVDELNLPRDLGRSPLIEAMFSYENFEQEELVIPGLALNHYQQEGDGSSKFDISLSASEDSGKLYLSLNYSTELFKETTISRFASYLKNIIEQILTDPGIRLSEIRLPGEQERAYLLELGTGASAHNDQTSIQLFREQVLKNPYAAAIVFQEQVITYQELDSLSSQLSHYLMTKYFLQSGEFAGVKLDRGSWLIIAQLAILKSGAAYVSIDPNYPESRIDFIARDSQCRFTIDTAFIADFDIVRDSYPKISEPVKVQGTDLAYVIYTSGSTGLPKGVMVTHQSLANLCLWHQEYYGVSEISRGTLYSSVGFDASVWEIYPYLISGSSLYPILTDEIRYDINILQKFFLENQITHSYLPSIICQDLVKNNIVLANTLILTGGDVLRMNEGSQLKIYNNYGPTENTVVTTVADLSAYKGGVISIGRPIRGSRVYILDQYQELSPEGVAGELCISGIGLARGYVNNTVLTAEKFVQNPFEPDSVMYLTGDLVRWTGEGNIEFLGRIDDQVKIRGYRIELGEIEAVISGLEDVDQALVLVKEQGNDKQLVAYYTAAASIPVVDLRHRLQDLLPDYMLPSYYVHLSEFPLTVNGKVDRRALPEIVLDIENDYQAPSSETEHILVRIWSEILKIDEDKISVNRSFFDLGGHSLKAMSLVNRIRKELGREVSLKVVFSHQDIRSLSAYILEMAFGSDYNVIPLAAEKTHYVLSSAQKRLYFLYEFDRDSLAYNMPQTAWLNGELDRERLAGAFQALIRRHEVFRTTIVMIEDEPFQVIGDGEGFSITDYQAQQEEVAGIMESFIQPFDLGQGPLLRVGLVHVPGGATLLMVDMHHIISDGASQGILIRDFMALYAGEDLPAPGLQYKDYAEWQQSAIEQDRMTKQRSFWLSEYQDLPEGLDLPLDYVRPKQAEHRSKSYSFELDEQTTRSISRLGEENGATLFMVLLSVYTILLSRLGNREDVVVGIPTAGRRHADLEGVIGVFINMLALRNYPLGELSFQDFLAEVSSRTLSCFDQQDFQYEDLVDELKLPRDTGRNPLFEATFSYQNYESESLSIPGLTLSSYDDQDAGGISKFDLSLFASEHSGCLYLSLVYSTALFSESSISRFGDYFQHMIKAVVADPGIQLCKLDLLSSAERSRLLELGKGASASYTTEETVVDLFAQQALRYPDGTAIVFEDYVLTYRELDQLSNQLASRLQSSHQIAAGDAVGICLGRSGLMLVGILGILKAGGVYVPFDIDYPQERKNYICTDAGIRLLLTVTDHVFDVVDYYSGAILALDVELDLTADIDSYPRPVVPIHGESLAYISYTSGSTGNPKGVMVPHQAILRLLSLSDIILDKDTVTLQLSSVSFDAATFEIWAALLSGGKVVIGAEGTIDISRLNSLIKKEGVNTLWLTSGLLDQWAESDLSGLPLRYLLSGGDVVRASSVAKVYRQLAGVRIYNGYGPTENTTFTCCYQIPRDIQEDQAIPIGRPITGTDVYVLNSSGSLSPAGVAGELCVSGLGLANGYVNNAVLTAEKFVENPFERDSLMYRTGDLVRWSADGNLLFLGRIDNQVKIRGYRIEPGEIEVVISGLEEVNQALVVVKEQGGDKYLVAYYTAAEAIADLKQRLQGLLPDYMLPYYYVHLSAFPLTANGKVDRRALPDIVFDAENDYEAPTSKMEHILAVIWSEILKIDQDKISVNRSFFDLGGHSLRAMSLANRIWKELGAEVTLKAIFSHQDIRSLSAYIDEMAPGAIYTAIVMAADKPHYVLSSAQKRMYFLYEFDRNSLAYNMPRAAWLSGEVDRERLAGAFQALIRRHEVLRTTIVMVEDEPFQVVGDGEGFSITDYQAQREEVSSVVERFIQPFDLGKGPLLRVGLVHVPDGESLLMVDMHHIITDGVSHGILIRDFMALYAGQDLPAPGLQYKDYAEWQQSTAEQERMAKQRSFWLSEYQDLPEVLDLPCDFVRPDHRNHCGDSYSFELDEQATASLRRLGEQQGATLYAVLLSVYTILLGRLGRREDVVVGTPIAGRRHADLDGMIGMFVNTLALRNYPLGELVFQDFLAEVSSRTLSCFDNQDFQYEDLVDELNLPRDLGRSPLIEVMFSYENFEREELVIPGLTLNSYEQEGEMSSKFDLSLAAGEDSGKLYLSFAYSAELFKETTISRFATYFKHIVEQVLAAPGIRLSEIGLLVPAECSRLVELGTGAIPAYRTDQTIVQLFEGQVLKSPDAVALVFEDQVLTYRELDERSGQLSLFLADQGVVRGTVIGLLLERSAEMIIGILGILKAGGTYVPIDSALPEERIVYMLADSGAGFLLTSFAYAELYEAHIPVLDISEAKTDDNRKGILVSEPEDLIYIIYTSGSSGKPKGVMVNNVSLVNYIQSQLNLFEITPNDRILQFSTISFDASVEQIWLALLSGAGLVLIGKDVITDQALFNAYLHEHQVTHLHATPSFLESISLPEPTTLRRIIAGGEVCRAELANRYLEQYDFYNEYGPTECTISCLVYRAEQTISSGSGVPVGRPVTGTSVYILDQYQGLSPEGVAGELYVSGLGLACGYVNNTFLTGEKFVENPFAPGSLMYRTGDLVRWTEEGNIEYVGRIDDQVKIRGYRIEPGEIEVVISGLKEVNQALVLVKEQGDDKYLVAYYTAEEAITNLKHRLQDILPDYMLPSYYVHLSAFPLTTNGKIDRRALPEFALDAADHYQGPANLIETKLLSIWSEVLKIDEDKISVNRSFFDLGGHSLKAMSLVNRIRKELGTEVSLKAVFSHQDIRSLSVYIDEMAPGSVYSAIPLAVKKPHYVLSSAQKRMYFLYEFDRDSLAYNMPQAAWLSGEVDRERLAGAFQALIRRHEVLRTTIVMVEDEPFQVVGDGEGFSITDYQAQREEVSSVVERFIQPFDLGKGPLLRVGLVHVPDGESLLMVDMHHIITDGVSHGILIRDFMALYAGQDLPAPGLQYKDYAEWQQSTAEQERMAKQRSFWLSEYQDLPEVLDLPCDFVRPDHRNHCGDSYSFELDEQATASLRRLGEQQGATLYAVLLSVYTILLGRLGRREDVVVGTPIAGRGHADLDGMIGMFVNTLALRNYPLGELVFLDFLAEVSSRTLSCFDNQDFQYEDLVDELNLPRDLGRSPLIEVMFSYTNFEREELVIPGLTLNSYEQEGEMSSKFDLSLAAGEDSGKLYLSFAYSAELFKETTISRFATYFKHIVEQVLAAPGIRLSEIGLLVPAECSRLVELGTGAIPAYRTDQTIVQLFEGQVLKSPDAVALVFEDQVLTYRELDERSGQLSLFLADQGVVRGTVIGLLLERSAEMIIGILGILKAGGTYVPIDSALPEERIVYMLADSGAGFLLTSFAYAELYEAHIPVLDISEAKTDDNRKGILVSEPEDLIYIIYTSGSSGKPKGVMVNNVSLVNYIQSQLNLFEITPNDRILQFSTISFDASVEQIWLALLSGAGLVLIGKDVITDQALFNAYLHEHQVTHLHATPSFLESISLPEPTTLRRIIAGGEVCRAELANRYLEQYDFYNEYGPTECTISCLVYRAEQTISSGSGVPVGRPVTGTSVYILDQYQGLSPEGVAGELYVSGLGLACGYVNNTFLTGEKFVENPFAPGSLMYRTGDLVRWTEEGNIEYVGRIDDQVKIRGYRIEPGEIEVVISGLKEVNQALVLVKEQGDDKYLVAYYTAEEAITNLKHRLQDILPDYMLPSYYVHLSAFPLTTNGKIDRRALPEFALDAADHYQGPANLIETKLLSIWSEVLKIDEDKISVNRSFFDLGGHSLKAIQLISQVNNKIKKGIGLVDLFKFPTIRSLARVIINLKGSSNGFNDENLILLRGNESIRENLFFIHEVSGGIQGYVELAGLLEQYNCWGLRSDLLSSVAPQNVDIKEIASVYIKRLKLVQKVGPYKIVGWSLGGTIALEMLQQLEMGGEKNNTVIMIDSPLPVHNASLAGNSEFGLEEERDLIGEVDRRIINQLGDLRTVQECWELAAEHFGKEISYEYVMNLLPKDMVSLIAPPDDSTGLHSTIRSVNTIRSLRNALKNYRYKNNGKLNGQVIYMKAETSDTDLEQLEDILCEKMWVVNLQGDHYDLLKEPFVAKVAEHIIEIVH